MSGDDGKWSALESMWAGLGVFLVVFGYFVLLPVWESWQQQQTNRAIVNACDNRVELTIAACVQDYKEAIK